MKQINKNNVKKVLAAAGKFVGQKAAPVVGLAAALTLPPAPVAAQEAPKPAGQKLVPNIELSFTVVNVQNASVGAYPVVDRTLDLDGDIRTTKDQVHSVITREGLDRNPDQIMRIGDEVVFILTDQNIKEKLASYLISINGQPVR